MRGIRAVLFDAGATLVHADPPVETIYARELARDGAAFGREELARALTRVWEEIHREAVADRYGAARGEENFWRGFLSRVRRHLDGGAVSEEAFGRLVAHFRDPASWSVYPDVEGTLDLLTAAGYRLGVVSNWDSSLPVLLRELGLATRFRVIAISAIEEVGKPESEIFHRACARLGVSPGEALHVGDSLSEDYEGARRAGLRALLLDRTGSHAAQPETIRSLTELAAHLETRTV